MHYQAVAFDMDGTLLTQDKLILAETEAAIRQILAKGIKVVLVTGRHHSVVYPYYYQLNLRDPVVCCNGTYLYDFNHSRALNAHPMPKESALQLLALVQKFGVHTLIYTSEQMTYEVEDTHLTSLLAWINSLPPHIQPKLQKVEDFKQTILTASRIYKFATSCKDVPTLQRFSQEVLSLAQFECEWSWVNRADVALKGNSKGNGLAAWAEQQNIALENIVAFGDSYNDLSMLRRVGLGIAMGNGEDEVKQYADRIIGSHNDASIAGCLTELFLY